MRPELPELASPPGVLGHALGIADEAVRRIGLVRHAVVVVVHVGLGRRTSGRREADGVRRMRLLDVVGERMVQVGQRCATVVEAEDVFGLVAAEADGVEQRWLEFGERILRDEGVLIESVKVFLAEIANGAGDQGGQRRRVDAEVHVRVVELGDEEHGHSVGQHPNVLVLIDLDVGREHQTHVVAIDDAVVLRIVRHRRVPAAHRVLVDQVEQHHAVFAHHTRRRVAVGAALLEVRKVMEAVLQTRFVAQDSRRHGELSVAGQRTEVQRAEAVRLDGRQCHAEDTLLAPLEVQAGHVEVTAQRIREEEAVRKTPRLVLFQRVHDQTVAELVREVGKGVVARLANVDHRVGDERVGVGVLGPECVAPDALVGAQIEDVDRVRANLLGGVADADGAGVEHPQAAAFVGLDAVHGVEAVLAVADRVASPIRVRYEFGRSRNGLVGVDVGQCGGDSCKQTFFFF